MLDISTSSSLFALAFITYDMSVNKPKLIRAPPSASFTSHEDSLGR